ncbi:MAG: helix-turn-helix transcriptional regulator [Xanthobacteraceae bacterium]|jgi:transcriptional regulator with XRE-family HTH domain
MPKRADAFDISVGKRVRAYRISLGMSQSALAEKVGVTFQQIQKYENGINRMAAGRLKRVAAVLGLPIAALLGENKSGGNGNTDDLLTEILSQPYATRLLRAFRAIKPAKERRALVKLAERMGRNPG